MIIDKSKLKAGTLIKYQQNKKFTDIEVVIDIGDGGVIQTFVVYGGIEEFGSRTYLSSDNLFKNKHSKWSIIE